MRVGKVKNILIIAAVITVFLVTIGFFVSRWLEDYTVKMNDTPAGLEPAKVLPVVRPDSSGWPAWKGPYGNNHSAFTDIITDWSDGLELRWKVEDLCRGEKSVTWSCPAVSGNHLVVPGRHDSTDVIFCLDPQSGDLLWYRKMHAPVNNSSYGEGPRATPTIDGDRVYTVSRGGLLHCLRLVDGSVLWKRNYVEMGAATPQWGFAGSPVVFDQTLIVQVGEKALVFGLNKFTGETVWQSGPAPNSYATPVIIQKENGPALLALGGQSFFGIDPKNGSNLWEIPWEIKNNINICTPLYSQQHKIAVISSWYNKGTAAVGIEKETAKILWHSNALQAHQCDPIILGDYLYGFSGMSAHNWGKFKCLDLLSGKEKWSTSELGSGQCIYIGPYLLSIDIKGGLYLSRPSPEGLTIVTAIQNLIETDNARFWTKPVVAGGNLYLRYANRLYCYRLAKKVVADGAGDKAE